MRSFLLSRAGSELLLEEKPVKIEKLVLLQEEQQHRLIDETLQRLMVAFFVADWIF